MGNPRSFTTKFNAKIDELKGFVRAHAGKSQAKRRAARDRAAVLPNRLPLGPRAAGKQMGSGKA